MRMGVSTRTLNTCGYKGDRSTLSQDFSMNAKIKISRLEQNGFGQLNWVWIFYPMGKVSLIWNEA